MLRGLSFRIKANCRETWEKEGGIICCILGFDEVLSQNEYERNVKSVVRV